MFDLSTVGQPNPSQPSPALVVNRMSIEVGAQHPTTKEKSRCDPKRKTAILREAERPNGDDRQTSHRNAIVSPARGHIKKVERGCLF
jgi:hypothetical protein